MVQTYDWSVLPAYFRHMKGAPKHLYVSSVRPDALETAMSRPRVAIVGTRRVTPYGRDVTYRLARELAARGVVIVSGLALGVDIIAHRAALDAGGLTIAVLPGSVNEIYPRSHTSDARRLLAAGGVLVSEYPDGTVPYPPNFVARNRIVSALSQALLITEATEKSGTSHTVTFAMEQGIDVMSVPGNITSEASAGTNNLLRVGGVIPVTGVQDALRALGLPEAPAGDGQARRIRGGNESEQTIIDLMEQGVSDGGQLLERSGLAVDAFNRHLTMLELRAKIRPLGANHWGLA